jgi:DNA polymerase III epsilon subunit-like protein
MSKMIFIDTETTSLNTNLCGMIQVAGIIDINSETVEEFNFYSNIFDGDEVTDEALESNKTTLEEIYQYPGPRLVFRKLTKLLEKYVDPYDPTDKFTALGYVSSFDNAVLREWWKKNGNDYFGSWWWNPWIDVMVLAAYVYQNERVHFESFKLSAVAKYAGITVEDQALHTALYDAKLCRSLYYSLMG